ncbi:MAG: ABC transporter substrate-binding protein [Bauldia sp.]
MSKLSTARRHWLAGAAALLATAFAGTAAWAQAAQPLLDLRLAVSDENLNPVTDSVLKLADTLGFYKKHGLNLTLVTLQGTPQAVAALNAGQVDIADISIDAALRLRAANGIAIRGIVSTTLGPPYLIAAKGDIKDVKGLAGRSFAIADNGSLDHNLTRMVLASKGVNADSPNFVTIGVPAVRVQALVNGRVDATTVSYGNYLPVASTPGLTVIVPPDEFFAGAPIQSKFIGALESTIAKKRDAIQRYVEAMIDISRSFDAEPDIWVAAMNKGRPDLSVDVLKATTKFLAGRWCVNGCLDAKYVQKTLDFVYSGKDFEGVPKIPATALLDTSFVPAAIKALGAYKGGGIDAIN